MSIYKDEERKPWNMTVAGLIKQLQELPPEAVVIQSQDGEGNGYSPTWEISDGWYIPESGYSGDWYHLGAEDEPEYEWQGPDEHTVRAVCLWPTN